MLDTVYFETGKSDNLQLEPTGNADAQPETLRRSRKRRLELAG
jgi:hypothetical protein